MYFSQKRGQVTVFIIIGIVVLLITGLLLFLKKESILEKNIVNEELVNLPNGEGVNYFVQSCLTKVSEQGVIKLGHQGGYYQSPLDYSIIFFDDLMPYYYADEKMMLLSINDSERELEKYLQENLPICLDNFSAFQNEGYQITTGNMRLKAKFKGKVMIELDYPIVISQGVSVIELNHFSYQINLDLPKYFSVSQKLVQTSLEKPGYVCLTCMENLAAQENMKIESYPIYDQSYFANDIIWYRLEDKQPKSLSGANFSFEFVIEYVSPEIEEPLQIDNIQNLESSVGEMFMYQVKANTEEVKFKDDTNLFDIKQNGEISFTPSNEQRGTHFITITAESDSGQIDQELFILEIN